MYLIAGYPKVSKDDSGQTCELVYQGVLSTLVLPGMFYRWKGYNGWVKSATITPLDGTNPKLGTLTITLVRDNMASSSDGSGSADPAASGEDTPIVPTETNPEETTAGQSDTTTMPPEKTPDVIEVDWAHIQRPIRTHKDFAEMADSEWTDIEFWEKEPTPSVKKAFQYTDNSSPSGPALVTLSPMAQKYARCIMRDVTTWDDYQPVVRRSSYYSNEPPQNNPCGHKEQPPDYTFGKQFVKTADRTSTTGKVNRFQRSEEWQGADEILVTKDSIDI